ncbi:MAG: hypothetical protein OEU36_24005 [Gammaproteobacteria bacterium]|nr:hypothetical protein [Gammaproteobacteria bacterium]
MCEFFDHLKDPAKRGGILGRFFLNMGDHFKSRLQRHARNELEYYRCSADNRASYARLKPNPHYKNTLDMELINCDADGTNPGGDDLEPVFYLPYMQNRLTRMNLKAPRRWNGPPIQVFATATINGCSVFIEGDPGRPKATHANAQQVQPTLRQDSFEEKQPKIQAKIQSMNESYDTLRTKTGAKAVHRPNYMIEAPNLVTARKQELANGLHIPVEQVHDFIPVGSAIGIRSSDTDNWTFFYQRCVSFSYTNIVGKYKSGHKVLDFGEFWPNGTGSIIPDPV